jgi:vacuolar-type H+-ATPase subunit I/STV1
MSENNPLTLAPQISALHQEILKSDKGKLEFAFQAGELLIQAKAAVKADKKGGWLEYLEQKCHIPQTTASLYRRLAENKDAIKEVIENQQRVADNLKGEGELSIRGALKLIPKTPKQIERANAAKATREANKAAAAEQAKAEAAKYFKSAEDMLQNVDVDELFGALRTKWDEERLGKLAGMLEDWLKFLTKERTAQAAEDPPAPPPEFAGRRQFQQPAT